MKKKQKLPKIDKCFIAAKAIFYTADWWKLKLVFFYNCMVLYSTCKA